jgi:DNA-binding winged helix-turn-helix (wHTH) protein
MNPHSTDELRLGRVLLQPSQRRIFVDGKTVPLRGRAFDLLLSFARHPGQLLSKQELLDLVWPGLVVEENNLQVQISSLASCLARRRSKRYRGVATA